MTPSKPRKNPRPPVSALEAYPDEERELCSNPGTGAGGSASLHGSSSCLETRSVRSGGAHGESLWDDGSVIRTGANETVCSEFALSVSVAVSSASASNDAPQSAQNALPALLSRPQSSQTRSSVSEAEIDIADESLLSGETDQVSARKSGSTANASVTLKRSITTVLIASVRETRDP